MLIQSCARHQVPRQLPAREVGETDILIECTNNPVPVGPHGAFVIEVEPVGVGIASKIQPVTCHMFPIGRALHQTFNQLLDRLGGRIREEGIDFLRTRGKSDEIEVNPSDEGFRLGERGRFESFAFETLL